MKPDSKTAIATALVVFIAPAVFAEQGILTLWNTGSAVLSSNEVATFRTYYDFFADSKGQITIEQGTNSYTISDPRRVFIEGFVLDAFSGSRKLSNFSIAGPATIRLDGGGLLTLDIQPMPTPP